MLHKPDIQVQVLHAITKYPRAVTVSPRKCIVKSGNGAQKDRCWIEFYNQEPTFSADLEDEIVVSINQTTCFRGRIYQKRIDSVDDILSLYAEWDPNREWNRIVSGSFENDTIPEILESLVAGSGLTIENIPAHETRFQSILFASQDLFAAIDVLAKIAGNWYWDLDGPGNLSFRLPRQKPDKIIFLGDDHYMLNLWQSGKDRFALVELHGGIIDGSEYQTALLFPEFEHIADRLVEKVYVRSLCSLDGITAFERAVREQMNQPAYGHYIDLYGRGEEIQAGETVQFLVDRFEDYPQSQIFRVKYKEIEYAHETHKTRLHVTSGLESAPEYFYYVNRDHVPYPTYLNGRMGEFQLDVSALDAQTHLD